MEKFLIGKVIDNYRILELLGRGGMGVVYKAEDVNLEKIMALKMIDPMLSQDESFLKRFRTEAKALAKLENPNIVTVHAFRETEFGIFLVMEFVEGKTLSEWIEEHGPMPYQKAVDIFKQILRAIGHAHRVGVIHRDIKPANIILTPQGVVKITDFGLAKIQRGPESTMTRGVGGTLKYISPEQAQSLRDVDHRTDIYSLGMSFYEVLAGRTPFDDADSEYSILKTIVEKKFPSPRQYNPDMPEFLTEIIMQAIEKEPEKRFQSANEMLNAIKKFEISEKAGVVEKSKAERISKKSTLIDNLNRLKKPIMLAIFSVFAITLFILILRGFSTKTAVSIASQPDGAAVYLNENYIGDTPINDHNLKMGSFSVRIQKRNYFSIDTVIATEKDQHKKLSFELEPSASVAIKVEPEDAQVAIDDKKVEPFHLTDLKLSVGEHNIRITRDGYETINDPFRLEHGPNQAIKYALNLYTNSKSKAVPKHKRKTKPKAIIKVGALKIDSKPPGATIWIDRLKKGVTPKTLNDLRAGQHTIQIRKKGYEEYSMPVTVIHQQLRYVYAALAELKKVTVKMVAVEPSGIPVFGTIYLDNKPTKRSTPQELLIPVGFHKIEVRRDGYISDKKIINLKDNIKLTFILKKSQ